MPTVVEFTTAGVHSWTVPSGVTSVYIEAWGGGGGSRSGPAWWHGAGGAAFAAGTRPVTPGESIAIRVGAGGDTTPTNGEGSYFRDETTLLAIGGYRAVTGTGAGGASWQCVGDVAYSGARGAVSSSGVYGGGGGGSAYTNANASSEKGSTGGAGTGQGGDGGTAVLTATAGRAPGGGGGGAGADAISGAGAPGLVRLTYDAGSIIPLLRRYHAAMKD